jgi:pimeloyl-ACP methyl ester carboxylesterase
LLAELVEHRAHADGQAVDRRVFLDPLVLLHGGFLDHHMWDDQIPVFASRYRVIVPDARGHGASASATRRRPGPGHGPGR